MPNEFFIILYYCFISNANIYNNVRCVLSAHMYLWFGKREWSNATAKFAQLPNFRIVCCLFSTHQLPSFYSTPIALHVFDSIRFCVHVVAFLNFTYLFALANPKWYNCTFSPNYVLYKFQLIGTIVFLLFLSHVLMENPSRWSYQNVLSWFHQIHIYLFSRLRLNGLKSAWQFAQEKVRMNEMNYQCPGNG